MNRSWVGLENFLLARKGNMIVMGAYVAKLSPIFSSSEECLTWNTGTGTKHVLRSIQGCHEVISQHKTYNIRHYEWLELGLVMVLFPRQVLGFLLSRGNNPSTDAKQQHNLNNLSFDAKQQPNINNPSLDAK